MRHLLSIDDLSDEQIRSIQERAHSLRFRGADNPAMDGNVGLLFFTSSLRTRLGFTVAALRIGANAIHLNEVRYSPEMSDGESFEDTLRTASGMLDAIVVRTPIPLDRRAVERWARCPVINAGDGGNEHPTQALIDLFAMTELRGPIEQLHVAIVGDARMRSVRSLVALMRRFCPDRLTIVSPVERSWNGPAIASPLAERLTYSDEIDLTDVDVVYMAGLAPGGGGELMLAQRRADFALTATSLSALPSTSIVISPMPIIDEISAEARLDSRIMMFEESDISVAMRMAVLEFILAQRDRGTRGVG